MAFTKIFLLKQTWHQFSFFSNHITHIAESLAEGVAIKVDEVRVHCSGAFGSVEDLTIILSAAQGSDHNLTILSQAMNGVTDLIFIPSHALQFLSGDTLNIALTNSGATHIGVNVRGWAV